MSITTYFIIGVILAVALIICTRVAVKRGHGFLYNVLVENWELDEPFYLVLAVIGMIPLWFIALMLILGFILGGLFVMLVMKIFDK